MARAYQPVGQVGSHQPDKANGSGGSDGLPGISTNLLTERLTDLKKNELIQRRILPPLADSAVYKFNLAPSALCEK